MCTQNGGLHAKLRLQLMRLLSQGPDLISHQLADEVYTSNWAAGYVLTVLDEEVEFAFTVTTSWQRSKR